ncbi:AGAMOUS-like 20 [Hibiscus syriacus]|uniref:AGAMOUS-like 20 n=1 Tax=Hibiscus syriacus TaxID=106335 RepID=A0A6A3C4U4_HIBSY|nr:AGAMOUS-like 20 [Hibiscus syriacus]
MGRDWYWRSKHSKRDSATASATLPGCITAVLHLFRFHCLLNHQTSSGSSSTSYKLKPHSFSSQVITTIAGTEAPRNSLESEEEDEILNIPMGIQIKTKVGESNNDIDTPGTKTPTLVARLMGLDLLPETRGGTRSLPVTPRTSSVRWSDVHHRHSLQINKENMSATQELIMSRLSSLMKRKELKHEYVKQIKESVSRKVGTNITNAHSTHPSLLASKSKSTNYYNPQHRKSSFSSSPRIQKQTSHKLKPVEEEQDEQQKPRAASKSKKGSNKKFVSRLKKPQQALEIIRNKKEEPFVRPRSANRVNIPDKKCRKIPLSNDLLNSKVPTLLVKKDPSPPATNIPQIQVLHARRPKHSSSSSIQTYIKQEPGQAHVSRCNNATITTTATVSTAGGKAEHEYIRRILRRTGLDKDTRVSISSWFSPSHPLDPSIFHYLENDKKNETKSTELSRRCNRKLLFHLVDELLSEILKPCFNMKPWVVNSVGHGFSYTDGSRLIDTLCSRIGSFPRSDCRVLEDIDALIGRDLPDVKVQGVMAYEEQGEGIVAEIEKDILENLVYEMAVELSQA